MKRTVICTCATTVAITLLAAASPAEGRQPYHQRIEQFFTFLKAGKADEAVNFIYNDNPWIAKSSDAVQRVLNQMTSVDKLVGQFRNYELLQEKIVGNRFAYVSYLVAYDRQPLRFIFEFYRSDKDWMTFSFAVDDSLDDDIEAAAKESILTH